MSNISYMPSSGLTYDPDDPVYWDPFALHQEIERVFEVCHGCRMCFKFCDSFPDLFAFVDAHDGDVRRLTNGQVDLVMASCFQCKLCEVQCPYTPRDGHAFQVDFPKLVHRWSAQKNRREGKGARDHLLGDPDLLGAVGRASMGAADKLSGVKLHRWFLEKVVGIHRDKQLPTFAPETFERWAEKVGMINDAPSVDPVLFQTCWVQNNDPALGRDTLEVMHRNGVPLRCVTGLGCCGMPAWEHGDLDTLRARASHNLDVLGPHVAAGAKVVVVNPTCAMMLRRELPELVAEPDRARAKALAEAVVDPGELLWSRRSDPGLDTAFASSPDGKIAYHAPCHLRAQAIGFRGRDLLRKLPGVTGVASVLECCGHDGTYAMKVEGFDASKKVGKRSFDELDAAEAALWVTDCPLAALQFAQHAGRKALHPMTVLARAYRGDSFADGKENKR